MWWFRRQSGNPEPALEQLGSLEAEMMEHVWLQGEISVRDLHSRSASRLAYTTIMTTVDRLYKKGMLRRRKVGKAYLYKPVLSRQDYRERLAQSLIGMALHDSQHRHAVLSCFVDVVSEADREMLDRLDELVKAKQRALRRAGPRP